MITSHDLKVRLNYLWPGDGNLKETTIEWPFPFLPRIGENILIDNFGIADGYLYQWEVSNIVWTKEGSEIIPEIWVNSELEDD